MRIACFLPIGLFFFFFFLVWHFFFFFFFTQPQQPFRINAEEWYSESINNATGLGCSSWTALLTPDAFVRGAPLACHSGSVCWATGNNSVGYNANEDSIFGIATPFNFSSFVGPAFVSFWLTIDTLNNRDGLWVEFSVNDGFSWQRAGAAGGLWYDGGVLIGSRVDPAFSGSAKQWRLVSGAIEGTQRQEKVHFRLRFRATGTSGTRGGVVVDDFVVSKSAIPRCPAVTQPDNGATLNPAPFTIAWTSSGAYYYDLALRHAGDKYLLGVGTATQWNSPALGVGFYEYSVHPREPDNTTNHWCEKRSLNLDFVQYIRQYPYLSQFENGAEGGWHNVDYDTGRVVIGPPASGLATSGSHGSVATTAGALSAVSWYVYESSFFNMSLLPASILSFDYTHKLPPNAGAQVQFSLNRGQSWHAVGAVGAGQNWYNANGLSGFNYFLGPGSHPGFSGTLNQWQRATYFINPATMPRDSWIACSSEVLFRFVVAIGSSATPGNGFAFDNLSVSPDNNTQAQCGNPPPFTPPANLTPAPTPVMPPTTAPTPVPTSSTAPTTESETTEATTTTTRTPSPTPVPTPPGQTTSRTTTSTTTAPTTGSTTTGPTQPPETTSRLTPTFAPTPAVPTEGEPSTTAPTTGSVTTDMGETPVTPREFPGWAIAVIVIGLCCFLLLFLLLAALLRNRDKKERRDAAVQDLDEAELRRGGAAGAGAQEA
jgi:hypothetical protein